MKHFKKSLGNNKIDTYITITKTKQMFSILCLLLISFKEEMVKTLLSFISVPLNLLPSPKVTTILKLE